MKRIDFHTHAFADKIAERAMSVLVAKMPEKYRTGFDGRLSTLVSELKKHGFSHAVMCQIATKPEQFAPIMKWSQSIINGELGEDVASMIIPLPSVHPDDADRESHLKEIAKAGFKGVKLHPYYQGFVLDDAEIVDLFKMIRDNGLFAEIHDGYDIGYPFDDICSPRRVMNLIERAEGLRLMVSHLGGWMDWDEVEAVLIGAPVDIEISMAVGFCEPEQIKRMLKNHPIEHLYFGSDWPWSDYAKTIPFLESCNLGEDRLRAIMGENAERFLFES